jgi:hypothetical protein
MNHNHDLNYVTGFEKRGHFAHLPNFHFKALISGTIAAMNLKPCMNIHPSSYYTRCEYGAPPTSGVGGASECADRVRKSPFYASLWQLTARDRRLAVASNIGFVK